MKKVLLLFSAFFLTNIFICAATLYAQSPNRLPSFQLLLANGKKLVTMDLREDKPVVLIYFAPDCDHCKTLMDDYFQKVNSFKTAQVLMVTFKPLKDVANFEKSYQTYKYANLIVASERSHYTCNSFLNYKTHLLLHCTIKQKSWSFLIEKILRGGFN